MYIFCSISSWYEKKDWFSLRCNVTTNHTSNNNKICRMYIRAIATLSQHILFALIQWIHDQLDFSFIYYFTQSLFKWSSSAWQSTTTTHKKTVNWLMTIISYVHIHIWMVKNTCSYIALILLSITCHYDSHDVP